LTEQESAAFFREIERQSPAAGRLLADERALAAAPPDQQCAAGAAIHQAILNLPADAGARVTVSLLRRSFEPASR
jgi:hypothetical protein